MRRLCLVICGLAAMTALPALATAAGRAASPAIPFVVASSAPPRHGGLQRRPAQIVYSGDGAAYLAGASRSRDRLTWTQDTPTSARATGADWHNDCKPACVDGRFHAYRATIHLYRPRTLGGFRVFTRMAVHYAAGLPPLPAARRSTTFRLRHDARAHAFFWLD